MAIVNVRLQSLSGAHSRHLRAFRDNTSDLPTFVYYSLSDQKCLSYPDASNGLARKFLFEDRLCSASTLSCGFGLRHRAYNFRFSSLLKKSGVLHLHITYGVVGLVRLT